MRPNSEIGGEKRWTGNGKGEEIPNNREEKDRTLRSLMKAGGGVHGGMAIRLHRQHTNMGTIYELRTSLRAGNVTA